MKMSTWYSLAEMIIKNAEANGFEAYIKVINGKPVIRIYDKFITMEVENGRNWNSFGGDTKHQA